MARTKKNKKVNGAGETAAVSSGKAAAEHCDEQPEDMMFQGQLRWGDDPVPQWAYDEGALYEVARIGSDGMAFFGFEEIITADFLANRLGPSAWYFSFRACILLWTFWAIYPMLVYHFAECMEQGFAQIPSWLIAVYFPILLYALYLEIKCYKVVLPLHVACLGPYKMFGRVVPFKAWYVGLMMISTAAHADLATSGIFTGRLIKTLHCPDSRVNAIWNAAVSQSLMKCSPNLSVLAVLVWLLMSSQLWLACMTSIPLPPQISFRDCSSTWRFAELFKHHPLPRVGNGITKRVDTCLRYGLCTLEAAANLAESARMSLVNFRRFAFSKYVLEDANRDTGFGDQSPMRTAQRTARLRGRWVADILKLSLRMAAYLLLESALMCNLQSSVIAVDKAAGNEIDAKTLLSLALSFLMAGYNIVMSIQTFVEMARRGDPYFDPAATEREKALFDHPQYSAAKRRYRLATAVFTFSAIVTSVIVVYATIKTAMAVLVCADSVWNLSGCVDLHGKISGLE